jgi:hypothetical protein
MIHQRFQLDRPVFEILDFIEEQVNGAKALSSWVYCLVEHEANADSTLTRSALKGEIGAVHD